MQLDMSFRGFAGMVLGMLVMRMGEMRVMGAGFVIVIGHMGSGLAMMVGRVLVMLRSVLVMLGGMLGMRHGRLPFLPRLADGFASRRVATAPRRTAGEACSCSRRAEDALR
jgi:hypothetical protein